jgi:hypothetical protein
MRKPPLLITASLDAGKTPYVALSATMDRVVAHMQGLLAWLEDPTIGTIVFAKNCAAQIRPKVLEEVAASHGKELEFVQVASSVRTAVQGKGYGEGDLIRQALERSDLLRASDNFIKITGKLYCPGIGIIFSGLGMGEFFVSRGFSSGSINPIRRNLTRLYGNHLGSAVFGVLKRKVRVPWGLVAASPGAVVDTRLYRVSRGFYLTVLGNSYRRVQDALGYTLERAFHDDLMNHSASCGMLEISPPIIGTSGSMGTMAGEFSQAIRAEAHELALRLME